MITYLLEEEQIRECALLIGASMRLVNPLLNTEAQEAIAKRIAKIVFLQHDHTLESTIVKGYQTQ